LLENSRDQSQLFHAMLLSLPGTPIIYYGDEIGMGDNIYLGDRDGVRTPMQWTGDRNAGFSRADYAQLYLPLLQDPVYGYQACNVEAEQRDPSSFLQWFRRLLAVRKQHPVFGLGSFEALHPENAAIFAYIRQLGDDIILCANNVSGHAQAAELNLSAFEGLYPVEMLGRERFPRIGELPYLLTFASHGFYWFQLVPEEPA
ncbi:MAG: alpha-glucosidase C-terminal domain-containing protein, partial [Actinomycetota bacterium]|nr:alpha-glucosidase C-terminal domain-containing protein [Actinomycetota bacterium]